MQQKYKENEMPYADFEKLGFSKERLFSEMNKEDWERFFAGKRTNIFEISVIGEQRQPFNFAGKFSLTRNSEGKVVLMMHPKRNEIKNDIGLTEKEIVKLQKGGLINKNIDGTRYLVQLDSEINELLKTKTENIILPPYIQNTKLTQNQKEQLRRGAWVELGKNDEKIRARIDLDSIKGLKFTKV
jgi:hypothetical protein